MRTVFPFLKNTVKTMSEVVETIDVLLRVIIEVYGLLHCIPEVLYLQLDNCWKKNNIFLDFVLC